MIRIHCDQCLERAAEMAAALIGREHPAALLRAEVERTVHSHGGLVLVTGEAGIGKTTLVARVVEEARELGALVLGGSCWDSANAPGYWPWMQVIRGLRRALGEADWSRAAAPAISVLLGESPNTAAEDAFTLYDAVISTLVTASAQRPVVIALDDLHWADSASLKLLEFAARHIWFERLLLIGTYRDVEVEAEEHPLQPLIAPLLGTATTITLTGLTAEQAGALLARTAGEQPEPAVVAAVHRHTGGNPFFVEQAARLWRAGSPIDTIAPGVRDAVRRRLGALPEAVRTALRGAAVLGREFHRKVLAACIAVPLAELSRLLDQAGAARLVTALGGGRYAFAHDLVRESLYAAMDEDETQSRHAAVVHALERHQDLTGHVPPAELARHAYRAGRQITASTTIDYLVAAARDAGSRLAAEEGTGHLRRAYELSGYDRRRRVVVGLDLCTDLQMLGQRQDCRQIALETVATARELDDAELLARVAITLHRLDLASTAVLTGELLREAHDRLVGASGGEPASAEDLIERLTEKLTVAARQESDDDTLSFGLWARHDVLWGPDTAAERESLTDELIALARRTGDDEAERFAVSLKWVVLLELGDPRFMEQYRLSISMMSRSDQLSAALSAAIDQQIICTLFGRFAEAADFLAQAESFNTLDQHEYLGYIGLQLRWSMLLAQGRFAELDELHPQIAESRHPHPALLAGITAVQRGDRAAVAELADAVAAAEPYPPFFRPLWLRFLASAAALCGTAADCERARTLLAPLTRHWLVSMYGSDISGPVELWFGLLDTAQQRWDAAVAQFSAATAAAERIGARPWAVESRAALADALLARDGSGDAAMAASLRAEARDEATELGLRHLLARLSEADSPPATAAESSKAAEPVAAARFQRNGPVWTLEFDGLAVHMADTKGLRDLRTLLGSAGTDVAAVKLLDPAGGAEVSAAARLGGDALLDEQAKAAYQRRIGELDEQIEDAARAGADARAATLDTERAALLDELRNAAGLGGRTRRLGDETERARKTVTARIRDTLRKLDEQHPALAAHLRATVTTGTHCRYQPENGPRWRL